MGFRFRKSFKIAPGLFYTIDSGRRQAPAQKGGIVSGLIGFAIIAVVLKACFGSSSTEKPVVTDVPVPSKAEQRLEEARQRQAEDQRAAEWRATLDRRLNEVAPELRKSVPSKALALSWSQDIQRVSVSVTSPRDPVDKAMATACNVLASAGLDMVGGRWSRVDVEIPPSKSHAGEKWGSVKDAINTERDWRGCPGSGDPSAFWSLVAAQPGFVDVYHGLPMVRDGDITVLIRSSAEIERLTMVVNICRSARENGIPLMQVTLVPAPERAYTSTDRLKGVQHPC